LGTIAALRSAGCIITPKLGVREIGSSPRLFIAGIRETRSAICAVEPGTNLCGAAQLRAPARHETKSNPHA
jgi:hypothetical protein